GFAELVPEEAAVLDVHEHRQVVDCRRPNHETTARRDARRGRSRRGIQPADGDPMRKRCCGEDSSMSAASLLYARRGKIQAGRLARRPAAGFHVQSAAPALQ
ncbi:MAG TPA: hypothetical protein PLY66_12010, partial [Acidobacteriota bacterium]|nr:hypothetical protein [Acidobacteriota bacterium]